MKIKKERLDIVLVKQGYYETVDAAKRAVMAGLVYSKEERLNTPGEQIKTDAPLTIKGKQLQYVSRGGLKLAKALDVFPISAQDKIVVDIGSSTGGFTDCALQAGAQLSYAIDVGYNQLAWKLRQDERVVVMERTNFRYLTGEDFKKNRPNFATIDVSFISLKIILPVLKEILLANSDVIALVKPQFEARREDVGEKGIVRDKVVHETVLEEITTFAQHEGYHVRDLSYSPITGSNGNVEFLLYLHWSGKGKSGNNDVAFKIKEIVASAHEQLRG